jgi:energy-coupling factor transport system substrate-specific component
MVTISLKRFTPANLVFLALSLAGGFFFLYPFWAPAQPSEAESRIALLLFSGSEAQTGLTSHTIAMVGTLIGLNAVMRLIETVIPLPGGFSPVFLLITLVGYAFGARLGFLMGALTMLITGPLTAGGLGPWTPYQMLAAGWIGLGATWLPRGKLALPSLVIYITIWGWLYGVLTNLYFWPYAISAPDIGWKAGVGIVETFVRYGRYYLVTSLIWDTARSIGNFLLMLVLGPSLLKALDRFKRRARVVWETP